MILDAAKFIGAGAASIGLAGAGAGIGVVFGPIRLLVTLIPLYIPIFKDGSWEALTTEGSQIYTPYFGSLFHH